MIRTEIIERNQPVESDQEVPKQLQGKKFHLLNSDVNPSNTPIPRNAKLFFSPVSHGKKTYNLGKDSELFQKMYMSSSYTLVATSMSTTVHIFDYIVKEQIVPPVDIGKSKEIVSLKLVFDHKDHVKAVKELITKTGHNVGRVAVFQLYILCNENKRDDPKQELHRYRIYDFDADSEVAKVIPNAGVQFIGDLLAQDFCEEGSSLQLQHVDADDRTNYWRIPSFRFPQSSPRRS
jgi:hypothetical protein